MWLAVGTSETCLMSLYNSYCLYGKVITGIRYMTADKKSKGDDLGDEKQRHRACVAVTVITIPNPSYSRDSSLVTLQCNDRPLSRDQLTHY